MKYPEGATPLDPDEMDGLRHKHVTTREELDCFEQANIQKGLQWMKRSRQADIIQESYMRELYRQLFWGGLGLGWNISYHRKKYRSRSGGLRVPFGIGRGKN